MFKGETFMFEKCRYRLQKRWVLLVSLLLLVVIAIWVVPSLISYVQQRRLISAAESLYHSMQTAQSYAKRYQKPITLILQQGDPSCYGVTTEKSCDCDKKKSCELGSTLMAHHSDIVMTVSNAREPNQRMSIRYSASGLVEPASLFVRLRMGRRVLQVQTDASGKPDICSSDHMVGYHPCH